HHRREFVTVRLPSQRVVDLRQAALYRTVEIAELAVDALLDLVQAVGEFVDLAGHRLQLGGQTVQTLAGIETFGGVADRATHTLDARVDAFAGTRGRFVDPVADLGVHRVDTLADLPVHVGGDRVEFAVLLVHVGAELVQPSVDIAQLVLEAVHAAPDALQPGGHAVQPAVELRERLLELLHDRIHRGVHGRDRLVLGFHPGHGLVEAFGEYGDLGAVRQFGQSFAHRADRIHRREPCVDVVEGVENLLLLALADFGRAHQHVAHTVKRRGRVAVGAHCD